MLVLPAQILAPVVRVIHQCLAFFLYRLEALSAHCELLRGFDQHLLGVLQILLDVPDCTILFRFLRLLLPAFLINQKLKVSILFFFFWPLCDIGPPSPQSCTSSITSSSCTSGCSTIFLNR